MRALANEIAKNLVLAGIGSLTVLDSSVVTEDDLGAQFFISEQDVGHNVYHSRPSSAIWRFADRFNSVQKQQHSRFESSILG